jgi:hypothetical protein
MFKSAIKVLLSRFQTTDTNSIGCLKIHVLVWYVNFLVLELAFTSILLTVYACTIVSFFESLHKFIPILARIHLVKFAVNLHFSAFVLHPFYRNLCSLHRGKCLSAIFTNLFLETAFLPLVLIAHQVGLLFNIYLDADQLFF